ncbi:UDP-glucose 4-epimerase GalE [Prochlorococcus marinus]|uniref:UDP-glucose 4-epimerase n=1 Tax=Prochlorococcus marinus XMU1408 TaxID=2213228 RepID=A0A318R567_PROMR|nr:UDP-glucose 4-epimerase GalE [Prochlorococcus marinus]MBW3041819.1 UDP-glucose 4-epimerase GalE [Prochlorococcus marinus str. XMU1408]PYE02958.1 UDP-glucose 4-epimerase GalE [Prochlorococcus marinus XMU1408]
MRILLTGGAGFIGSHISLLLLQKGFDLVILDSFVNSSTNVIKVITSYVEKKSSKCNLKIINGDIRDRNLLEKIFIDSIKDSKPIQAVIHLAGLKSVADSVLNPLGFWDVNVCGTNNLLETMSKNECYSIVFSSSATIYGLPDSLPIREDHKVSPINPYGETKVAIEKMLEGLYKSNINLWRICSLRYFNPVGAHPSGLIGEDPIGIPSNLFPYISQVAAGRREFLNVFGDDWDTNDGSGVRDYIHIMDLSEGHIAAIDYLTSKESCFEFINLGSGKGYSVFEIINQFELSTGVQIPFIIKGRRVGDIAKCYADISKAKNLLNWFPKRSLEEICLDGWNWQKNNPNGYIL